MKYEKGQKLWWNQRMGYRVRRMTAFVMEVIDENYIYIAPRENADKSWWKKYHTSHTNFNILTK